MGLTAAASPERQYFAHLSAGRFMIQHSRARGEYVFYPRIVAPGTGAADLEWVAASGLGTVHSSTLVRQKAPGADYNVVLVELDEGPRMISRVEGMREVPIGLRVRARVSLDGDAPVLVFEPQAPS